MRRCVNGEGTALRLTRCRVMSTVLSCRKVGGSQRDREGEDWRRLEAGTYNLSSLFVVAFRTAHQGSRRSSQQKGRGGGEERDQDEKEEEAIAARVHVIYIAERGRPVRVGLEEELNDSSSLCSSLSSHVPLVASSTHTADPLFLPRDRAVTPAWGAFRRRSTGQGIGEHRPSRMDTYRHPLTHAIHRTRSKARERHTGQHQRRCCSPSVTADAAAARAPTDWVSGVSRFSPLSHLLPPSHTLSPAKVSDLPNHPSLQTSLPPDLPPWSPPAAVASGAWSACVSPSSNDGCSSPRPSEKESGRNARWHTRRCKPLPSLPPSLPSFLPPSLHLISHHPMSPCFPPSSRPYAATDAYATLRVCLPSPPSLPPSLPRAFPPSLPGTLTYLAPFSSTSSSSSSSSSSCPAFLPPSPPLQTKIYHLDSVGEKAVAGRGKNKH